jgi:hypothetical protein
MYKNILDNQVSFNKQLQKGYGNMTSVEKRINKDDLLAYKNYDNKQYAMIPGYNSSFTGGINAIGLRSSYRQQPI